MERLVLSTDDVREADRFSYWREEVNARLIGASTERDKGRGTAFHASFAGSMGASAMRIRHHLDGVSLLRRPRDIARLGWDDHILLYREMGSDVWVSYGGREFTTATGDIIVADPTIPSHFATRASANYDVELWFFPRKLFDPHLAISQRPRSLVLSGFSGLEGMVKTYLDAFAVQIDTLDDRAASLLADNFCRLLAVACGGSAGEQRDAVRSARLAEAQRYIGLHLADPHLTPEKAAAALKISVRQLHLLFEPSGTSFAQYVMRRRLEECRAALMAPASDRSVTDIALAWGFNSLATFYRTFREAFGATPNELRSRKSPPG